MKNNKFGVALILALVMIVQSFCAVSVFAQDASAPKTPVESAGYDLLSALGMLPDGAIYYSEDAMTRGQFAYIAARLSGWNGNSQGETPFVDVADSYLNKDAITYLYNTGIVQGTGGLEFNPEGSITYIDATSIMIKILGYGAIAPAKYGEYPLSHIRMGDSLDLDDDLGSPAMSDALTCDKAITLLCNAAAAPMAIASSFGDTTEYTFEKKDTLLYTYYDIVKSEGVVTDDSVSAINGASTLNAGAAIISGVKLAPSTNGYSAKGLLGMYVDYYYIESNMEFVYAQIQTGTSDVITITYDMLAPNSPDFSITNIVYYTKNDKVKNAQLAANVDLVYNGGAYPAFGVADLKIKSGYITLIDRDTDKVYDAVSITEYNDVVIKGYDITSNTIYTEGGSILLEEYNQYIITDLNGTEIKLESLAKDTIASVVAAKDKSAIQVISCAKNVVQGVVSYADTTEHVYYVNDKGYELSNQFIANNVSQLPNSKYPDVGENYRLLLNADGNIVKAVYVASNSWYTGYCIGVGPDGTGIGVSAKMRAMTPQGGLLDLYFANKVSVNGEAAITPSKLLESTYFFKTAEDGSTYPIRQPLKYRLDSWGKITAVEVAVDNTNKAEYKYGFDLENFSKDKSLDNTEFKADLVQALNGMYFVTKDTLVISDPYMVDEQANAYEYEDVELIPALGHGEYDPADLYEVDEHFNVGMIIFKGSSTSGAIDFSKNFDDRAQSLFVVDKVMRKLDEEGEEIKVITGVSYGGYVEYPELEEGIIPADIKFGDICAYGVEDGKINGIHVLKSAGGDEYGASGLVDGNRGTEVVINSEWSTQYAPLYSVAEKSFVVKFDDPGVTIKNNGAAITMNNVELYSYSTNGGNVKVTVLDRESKTVRPGTFADVYTNVTPDSKGNATIDEATPRVFVYRRFDYAREIVFIK